MGYIPEDEMKHSNAGPLLITVLGLFLLLGATAYLLEPSEDFEKTKLFAQVVGAKVETHDCTSGVYEMPINSAGLECFSWLVEYQTPEVSSHEPDHAVMFIRSMSGKLEVYLLEGNFNEIRELYSRGSFAVWVNAIHQHQFEMLQKAGFRILH